MADVMSDDPTISGEIPPPAPPTALDAFRANHTDANSSDYVLSRQLYDQGLHGAKESYPEFAGRMGVKQIPLETALNKVASTGSMGLSNPIESGLSGLGSLLSGGNFGDAYKQKRQELADQEAVGASQNPKANFGGDAVGTVGDYLKFGPALRAGAEAALPGMGKLANSGPLGDSIAKFFGLGAASEIPKMLERQAGDIDASKPQYGFTPGQDARDVVGGGVIGAGGALVGHGVGKALGAVVGPLVSGIGNGLVAADNLASAWPRSVYTKAAETMGKGFTGETTPAEAAHTLDQGFYDRLLGNSGMNVGKGVDDLLTRMDNDPATAQKILKSAQGQQAGQTGTFDLAANHLDADNIPGGVAETKQALQTTIARLNAEDPSGAKTKDFVSNIYGDLIPERLTGPFRWSEGNGVDPTAAIPKPAVSSTGALIDPPVSGTGALSQALWERLGGGPGRVMWPLMASQPKTAFAGATSLVQQLGSIPLRVAGYGLDVAGKGIGAAAEPGTAAVDGVSKLFSDGKPFDAKTPFDPNVNPWHQNGLQQSVAKTPGAYQTGLYTGANDEINQPNPNRPLFPDLYHPPAGQQHTELPTGADVQQWLGSTDRGSGTNFVASKLGPDVAHQLAQTDDAGYKAALFNIASDPGYRKQLASSALPSGDSGAGDIPT